MKFNLILSIQILERTPLVLETLLSNLSDEWIQNNEGENTWSPFDVVGHLIHGENTDWIPRLEIILGNDKDKRFVQFDRFAQFNDSKGKSLEQLIEEFKLLRKENIEKLKSKKLTKADLLTEGIHPDFGAVTISHLLSAWVVHDLNHLAQIERVMAVQLRSDVGPWKEYLPILNR